MDNKIVREAKEGSDRDIEQVLKMKKDRMDSGKECRQIGVIYIASEACNSLSCASSSSSTAGARCRTVGEGDYEN